jgi:hypothetical protein
MIETKTRLVSSRDIIGISKIEGRQINIKGNEKTRIAIEEMSKYGLITFSREQSFKSTNYTIHFIKPVDKLKQLYNLGDEVLILCCNDNFREFKSRTKDFLDFLLTVSSEYKNRLDKITCFLFDDCEDIVDRVKQDRTENPDSRLIVPFSYSEIDDGLTEDFLQARLRTFLYERDLFGVATPLQNDNMFFGKDRTDIISELFGKYRQGEHGGLFGLRKIGKTSILNLLQQRVDQSNGVVKYFDCTKYHHLRWYQFLRQIIIEIGDKYLNGEENSTAVSFVPDEYDEMTANLSFEKDLKKLYNLLSNKRMLFIFDEIEQISYSTSPSQHWKNENDSLFFWQAIRSIFQTDSYLFSFVITGVNPKCIEDSKINGTDNPIFNILTPIFVPLFDYSDVKNMVSNIGRHLGLSFDEEIFAKLVDDYGGHPFLTRQVCSKINNELLREKQIRPYNVSKYTYEKRSTDYRTQMEAVFAQILGVLEDYYPNEYELLKILALDGSDKFKRKLPYGDSSISHLLGYCLVRCVNDDYYIRIKSIGDYLIHQNPYDITLTDDVERREQIVRRRSIIENAMRSLIASQLRIKYGKKAREQLIQKINGTTTDKTQEPKIKEAPDLAHAMQELYFSQLKELILKDWKDYNTIFVDRVKFEQFFETINKFRKVDAHSSSISDEDNAILHIAFKYFEDKLLED